LFVLGVRKEEIRVEVEDARYLVIRTELLDAATDDAGRRGRRSFARKFRLPGMVDADGISADYAHGVLAVTVPRMHTRLKTPRRRRPEYFSYLPTKH
jgi:HSP20 family protein